MASCEIITIGSELLDGRVLNTNARYLAREASRIGLTVTHQSACRDDEQAMMAALREAMNRSRVIFVTGGLGSTPDDLTRSVIARFFGCGLKQDKRQYQHIVRYFKALKRRVLPMTREETYLPENAKPLLNRWGIALGFYIATKNRLMIVLPGVPREMVAMFEHQIPELIHSLVKLGPKRIELVAKIAGIYETQVMKLLGPGFFRGRNFDFGIYPELGEVTIRIKADTLSLTRSLRRDMAKALGQHLYSFEDDSFAQVIGDILVHKKQTMAVAESCTGGFLSQLLTEPPGASRYFQGSLVAYQNEIKNRLAEVPMQTITKKGAVSREVARALAISARVQFRASYGVSITGIAGPGGGSVQKPVGLVYIAIADKNESRVFPYRFMGDRSKIRQRSAWEALYLFWRVLKKSSVHF